jgi:hypothetical protein
MSYVVIIPLPISIIKRLSSFIYLIKGFGGEIMPLDPYKAIMREIRNNIYQVRGVYSFVSRAENGNSISY